MHAICAWHGEAVTDLPCSERPCAGRLGHWSAWSPGCAEPPSVLTLVMRRLPASEGTRLKRPRDARSITRSGPAFVDLNRGRQLWITSCLLVVRRRRDPDIGCHADTVKLPPHRDQSPYGGWEQDSDVVVGLYRDELVHPDTDDRGLLELIVLKNLTPARSPPRRSRPSGTAVDTGNGIATATLSERRDPCRQRG
jgi:hypothetical protein